MAIREWRVVRGTVVGCLATGLSAIGHTVSGGDAPTWVAFTVAAVGVGVVSFVVGQLPWTVPRLLVLLLSAQALMHALFSHEEPPPVHPGHQAAGAVASAVQEWPMLLGHVAATLVTAVLLRRGDAWLSSVLEALALRATRLLGSLPPAYGVRAQPVAIRVRHLPRGRDASNAHWQRGPPAE